MVLSPQSFARGSHTFTKQSHDGAFSFVKLVINSSARSRALNCWSHCLPKHIRSYFVLIKPNNVNRTCFFLKSFNNCISFWIFVVKIRRNAFQKKETKTAACIKMKLRVWTDNISYRQQQKREKNDRCFSTQLFITMFTSSV